MKKIKIKIKIAPDNTCYGFGAFLRPPKKDIDKEPLILLNFQASLFAAAEFDLDFYDLLAENAVHEMLHQMQYIFKKQFGEIQVRTAIEQAKKYIEKDNIEYAGKGNKKRKEEYIENLNQRLSRR
jgi:hypothetical protein